MQSLLSLYAFLLFTLPSSFLFLGVNAEADLFMTWSAFTQPDCSSPSSYDFLTPIQVCLNISSVAFNPFNFTSASTFMQISQKGDKLIAVGCTTNTCVNCLETQVIEMKPCIKNAWLGNTTAYFSYDVVEGLVPQSKAGGIIYQFYDPSDSSCKKEVTGANIQENGVCVDVGGGFFYYYSCNSTTTILTECSDSACTQDCTSTAYAFDTPCSGGSTGNTITTCYI